MAVDGRRLVSFAVFGAAFVVFACIAWAVAHGLTLHSVDRPADVWLHTHATPSITPFIVVATNIARPLYLSAAAFLIAAWLWYRRQRYRALVLVLAVPGGNVLNFLFKYVFSRHRPDLAHPIMTLSSYSFPSGHAMGATVFYGTLAVFAAWRFSGACLRILIVLVAVLIIAFAAFSRVYLGLHYPSDVIAGIAEGIGWIAFSLEAIRMLMLRTPGIER